MIVIGGLDIARAIASVQAVIEREMASRDELTRRTSATLDIGPRARERDAQEHPLVSHPGAMLQNLSVRSSDDTRVRGNEARGGQKSALAAKTDASSERRHVSPDSALETTGTFGSFESEDGSLEDDDNRMDAANNKRVESMTNFMNSARESQTSAQTMASADLTRSGSRQQIDRLLDEAMSMFHRDGPLVNPLERCASTSSMEMRMRFVCEAKGFDYGLFWEFDEDKKSLTCVSRVCIPDASGISLFVDTSFTMFKRFSMGFGMPGRIGYTGNYEWHEDIRQLPAWSFQRKRQAEQANIRTVIGVPLDDGVVEFGTRSVADHNVTSVQYIQKLCQVSKK